MITKEGNGRDYTRLCAFIICLLFAAVSARWVLLYRTGGALDIDEAGYIGYAVALERALIGGGIAGWIKAFLTPIGQAPLTMVFGSLIMAVVGTHSEWVALLTNSVLLFFLLSMVYSLANREYGSRVAVLSVMVVGTTPYIIDYARLFNFSTPTALFFIATIYCYRHTEGMSKIPWVVAVGCCAALMVLSRTMALAFLPAFAAVFLVESIFWRTPWKRLLLSIFVGSLAFIVVCGPWFAANFHIVFEYLLSFGYGRKAAEYGAGEGVFTYDDIMFRLYLFSKYTKIVHIILFLVGICAILANVFLSKTKSRAGLSFAAHVLLLSFLCLLILMSSRNIGTAFDLPLLPPLIIAMVGSLAHLIRSVWLQRFGAMIVLLSVFPVYLLYADQAVCEKSEAHSMRWGFNLTPVAFCGGIMENYIGDRYGHVYNGEEIRKVGGAWMDTSSQLSQILTDLTGSERGVVFASRHILANVNAVNLKRIKTIGSFLPLQQIDPASIGSTIADYAGWLSNPPVSNACYVVALNKVQGEFPFAADPDSLRSALSELHYSLVGTVQTPAEGQWFDIFRSPAPECGKASGSL